MVVVRVWKWTTPVPRRTVRIHYHSSGRVESDVGFPCTASGWGHYISIETGYKDGVVTEPVNPTVCFTLRDPSRKKGLREDCERTQGVATKILG